MTRERANEIISKVFYRHIDWIMRDIERCESPHTIFQVGMEMGRLHKDLVDELEKEICEDKE